MNYAMLTENGLNKINEAHAEGLFLKILYYVPVYDYRSDVNIGVTDSTISATEISTITSSSDLHPTGEIIWNNSDPDSYSLSDDQKYLVYTGLETTATSGSGITISDFAHKNPFTINTFKSSAISPYYTADTIISPGNSGTSWFLSNDGYSITPQLSSVNDYSPLDIDNPTSNFLFKGVTYQNVISSADQSRANFKVNVRCPVGNFKFNKIGLYACLVTEDFIISTNPFLLAQVSIPEPEVLYSNQTGSNAFALSELTLDFQIETRASSADFENVFYSTSGDYWVRTSNEGDGNYGLLYDGSVYVSNRLAVDDRGNFLNSSADTSVSKVFISTFERVNKANINAEKDMPQLCLQYVENGKSNRIRTTFKTNVSGDCELDLYGACQLSGDVLPFSVIPSIDKEYGLGTYSSKTLTANRWNHLMLSDKLEMFDDTYDNLINSNKFRDFYVKVNSNDNKFNVYNGDVYCGPYFSSAMLNEPHLNNSNYFYGNISSYRSSASNGTDTSANNYDLLVRSLNDMVLITFNNNDVDKNWANSEQIISEVWNLRDGISPDITDNLGTDKNIALVAGNKIYTYGSLIPLTHGRDSVGDQYKGIKKLWVDTIGYAKSSNNDRRNRIIFDSSITPNGGKDIGEQDNKWYHIHVKNLGWGNSYVEKGFITSLTSNNIIINDGGKINYNEGLEINGNVLFSNNTFDLGKDQNRIRTLYVDNIVLTNKGETYSVTIEFDDLTAGKIDGKQIRSIVCKLTFIVVSDSFSNTVTIQATTDIISCREPSGSGGTGSNKMVDRNMFFINNFYKKIKEQTNLTGTLSMPSNPTTGLSVTEYKNNGYDPSGGKFIAAMYYDQATDIMKIVNKSDTRWNKDNYWKMNNNTLSFIVNN